MAEHSQLRMYAGRSILEILWARLDELVAQAYLFSPRPAPADLAGEIKGVIFCIATMLNPYDPNPMAVRKQAVQRYKEGQ